MIFAYCVEGSEPFLSEGELYQVDKLRERYTTLNLKFNSDLEWFAKRFIFVDIPLHGLAHIGGGFFDIRSGYKGRVLDFMKGKRVTTQRGECVGVPWFLGCQGAASQDESPELNKEVVAMVGNQLGLRSMAGQWVSQECPKAVEESLAAAPLFPELTGHKVDFDSCFEFETSHPMRVSTLDIFSSVSATHPVWVVRGDGHNDGLPYIIAVHRALLAKSEVCVNGASYSESLDFQGVEWVEIDTIGYKMALCFSLEAAKRVLGILRKIHNAPYIEKKPISVTVGEVLL